jgi:hypothetical protein
MQDCLNKAQEGGLTQLRAAARTLLGVCRSIEVHALGTGKRMRRVDGDGNGCGHTHAMTENETIPHAAILASSTLESCCLVKAN